MLFCCWVLLFLRSLNDEDDVGRNRDRFLPNEKDDTIAKFATMRHTCIIRCIGLWKREDNGDRIVCGFCVGGAFCVTCVSAVACFVIIIISVIL